MLMSQQRLTESLERMKPQLARRESRTASALSLPRGLHPLLQLQRTIGNRAVERLLQAKLAVSHPGDPYEREADRVAEQVTRMSVTDSTTPAQRQLMPEEDKDKPPLQTKPLAASIRPLAQRQAMPEEEEKKKPPVQMKSLAESLTPLVQRQTIPEEEEKKKPPVQMKSTLQRAVGEESVEAGPSIEQQLGQSSGKGSPLPESVRAYMEPRFGVDFSAVRVHTGSESTQLNRSLSAQAFTHGSDIYFGEGQSPTNLELTAHELTHVVQQTGGVPLQTKKREEEGAPPSPEPSIQRICAACAAGDKEKKGSDPHLARVRQTLTAAQIQGKWNFAGVKQYSGGGEGDSTSGNGSIFPSLTVAGGSISSALASAYTEQKLGFLKSSYGGRAKAFRWVTAEYRFKNDHDGAAFLHLSGKATISGWAKAEDLQYARGAALVVGRITENPARTRTSAELFTPLKEGGISAASVEKDQGQIEAEVPVGDGKVNITIPLTKVKEGTQVPINDVNSPTYNVPNSVDEVDITIIVRADADADIEDEVWGGLLAAGDENIAKVVANFFLDWESRPESQASTTAAITAKEDKLNYPGDCKRKKLISAANKDGCSTKEGGKHTIVNKNGNQITTIPHDVKENQTCRSIIKVLNDECLQ